MEHHHADGRALFEEWFRRIERTIAAVVQQKRLKPLEAQELYSLVMLKIVRDDYAVLRKVEGRSCWRSYLKVIVRRVLHDERIRRWGRWRPSARAQRLGPLAIRLEKRINRDGWSPSEAIRHLQVQGAAGSRDDLMHLAEQIPRRPKRFLVSDSPCLQLLTDRHRADQQIETKETQTLANEVELALGSALAKLTLEERQLLDLRYRQGWTVQRIAKAHQQKAQPLYRRFVRILRKLRRDLERLGIDWPRVAPILDTPEIELEIGEGRK